MNNEEIKLKTIANIGYQVQGIFIKPKTLYEVIEYGYDNHNSNLNMISMRKENIFPIEVLNDIPQEITLMQLLIKVEADDLLKLLLDAFQYFTKSSNVYLTGSSIYFDETEVKYGDLCNVIDVIKIQNAIVTQDERSYNPINERARQIKEKLLANKKKIQELNEESSDDEGLTFLDLISIVCANVNGVNIFNVFDLNMFQFNNQFNRMQMLEQYETNVQSVLHGADSKSIDLKHWMSKLK